MKTKASIMGHPVHMSLAHFPVAFLIGAFAFGVAAKVSANGQLASVAAHLLVVGLVAGVLILETLGTLLVAWRGSWAGPWCSRT